MNIYKETVATRAREFAEAMHGNQMYGEYPYITHLDAVADLVAEITQDSSEQKNIIAAAYLHDTLEDTPATPEDINDGFGRDVMTMVLLVTDPEGETRKERKEKLYENFRNFKPATIGSVVHPDTKLHTAIVKCADRYCNIEFAMKNESKQMRMYLNEWPAFMTVYGLPLIESEYNFFWQMMVLQFARLTRKFPELLDA